MNIAPDHRLTYQNPPPAEDLSRLQVALHAAERTLHTLRVNEVELWRIEAQEAKVRDIRAAIYRVSREARS
ncbi:MAG: hypothetical protein LC772_06745 [Chloroflexi bacterium]|nr:hypothetical protein [Chloroflexota bacterium]